MAIARRIVSLISSASEILYLLDLGERVVGVSHECNYPADVATKPRLTRSLVESSASSRAIDQQVRTLSGRHSALYEIDVERLAALAPDLIITQAQCDVCAVRYEDVVAAVRDTPALKHTEILALNPHSLADVLDDIERVGQAIGEESVAVSASLLKGSYLLFVMGIQIKGTQIARSNMPRAVCLEWIDPPMLAANWMPQLVTMAGGEPGLTRPGAHSNYADWRQIVDYDPQAIVIMPCGFDLARTIAEAQVLAGFDGWAALAAVRDRRVFAVDGNAYFNRSGPRLVDSLEILAHLLHPDFFRPPRGDDAARAWRRLETRGNRLVPL
jgi:iron complex transport system substrate-binding protein